MENLNKKIWLVFMCVVLFIALASFSAAKTTCERDGCDITITINIAYFGATQDQIDDWNEDIDNTWNGEEGHQTYGECKCNVYYEVNSTTTTNCTQTMSEGYHCIMVTAGLAKDTANKTYRGYMYSISKNGSSTKGWWSSQINQALPGTQGDIHDAAHEAGHMMGLGDDYNASAGYYGQNIMGRTWGVNATPTQEQVDTTVENNCKGDNAECPDICCCGNGKIDKDKGESCDPEADPTGCGKNEQCTENCTCIKIPSECGDGLITGAEECDPEADPTGCNNDEECNNNCECEKKESKISIVITEPDNKTKITGPTDIKANVDSDIDVEEVKFYVDDALVYTDVEASYKWEFNPADYGYEAGEYEIEVKAYDEDGNMARDEITIIIKEANISAEITSPENNATINETTDIEVNVNSTFEVEEVKFYVDDLLQDTIESPPWAWALNPADFDDGLHEIKVIASDVAGNTDEDLIIVATDKGA